MQAHVDSGRRRPWRRPRARTHSRRHVDRGGGWPPCVGDCGAWRHLCARARRHVNLGREAGLAVGAADVVGAPAPAALDEDAGRVSGATGGARRPPALAFGLGGGLGRGGRRGGRAALAVALAERHNLGGVTGGGGGGGGGRWSTCRSRDPRGRIRGVRDGRRPRGGEALGNGSEVGR